MKNGREGVKACERKGRELQLWSAAEVGRRHWLFSPSTLFLLSQKGVAAAADAAGDAAPQSFRFLNKWGGTFLYK